MSENKDIFSSAKKEKEEIDRCVREWACGGETYKIPLLNGDLIEQAEFLEVADKYDIGANGKPSELAAALREFMYKLLKMRNEITEEQAGKLATVPNCSKVYNIWLGNAE